MGSVVEPLNKTSKSLSIYLDKEGEKVKQRSEAIYFIAVCGNSELSKINSSFYTPVSKNLVNEYLNYENNSFTRRGLYYSIV